MQLATTSKALRLALVLAAAGALLQFGGKLRPLPAPSLPVADSSSMFPEPNKPPHFYVSLGGDWVDVSPDWSIRLDAVLSDTRCPNGVVCEESGSAEARFQIQEPNVDYHAARYETIRLFGVNRFPMPDGEPKPSLLASTILTKTNASTGAPSRTELTLVDLRPYPSHIAADHVTGTPYVALVRVTPVLE